jgi:hypothetical protein
MTKVFINLNQTTGGIIPNGWTASVAIAHGAPGKNQVAIGESIIYNTKQQAWDTIRNRAENLDYVADEIFFNYQRVDSFVTVEQMVQAL